MAARLSGLTPLVLGISLGASILPAQEADSARIGRIVAGETLRRAGATRLGDLLVLAGRWDVATVDGFTWQASPLGGGPFGPARWTVLVDGRRIDLDLFGSTSLDRLGIPLDQISYVELVELPHLEAGRLTSEGMVHIHTAEPAPGPSADGWYATGSEVGDPGPFAFTPKATPNVDRTGHDASVRVAYGGGSWFAAATLVSGQMVPTDPAIVERYVAALGSRPRLHLTAPAVRLGARLGGGSHEVTVRHSDVGGALGLKPFGTEIATRERFTHIGLMGAIPDGNRRALSYDVTHSVNRARSRRAAFGPAFEWDARTTEARLELSQRPSVLRLAGVRLRHLAVHSPDDLDAIALATAYAQVDLGAGRPAGATAAAAITFGEGDLGLAALLTRTWKLTSGTRLEGVLAYQRTVQAEDNSIWAWTERGYGLLPGAGVQFDVVGSRRGPERIAADAVWSSRPAPTITFSARVLYRRERSLSLERRRLHFVPDIGAFEGRSGVVHGGGGELGGGAVEIGARPFRGFDARLSYWYRRVLGGDSLFREVWASVPRHGARASVEYVPVAGLELWMAAGYRGQSRWAEFAAVVAESAGRYSQGLADAFTIDVAVQKWLWDERLRAHIGIRNLLGAELRYHPAGATFGPTALVQLEGRLP